MSDLIFHLKHEYFQQIKDGTKAFEYRLVKPYWERRLMGIRYDRVIFWDAYKPRSPETVIIRPYQGFERQTITHKEFGNLPVKVFAIIAR